MKVLEIQHLDKNGKVLWRKENLHNLLHLQGEEFILLSVFLGGKVNNDYLPDNFYLGMDNRSRVLASDAMTDLAGEPAFAGYERAVIPATGSFIVTLADDNHYRATSPIVAFTAAGGGWGPVQNLFLTNQVGDAGYLISTISLGISVTLTDGESVTVRVGMALRDCS